MEQNQILSRPSHAQNDAKKLKISDCIITNTGKLNWIKQTPRTVMV